MKRTNILNKNEELSDEQYCLYHTRLKNTSLLSTQLVGNIFYTPKIVENSIYAKGEVLLEVRLLGLSYEYVCHEKIKIVKQYCRDGDIVDYNMPILLMERMES